MQVIIVLLPPLYLRSCIESFTKRKVGISETRSKQGWAGGLTGPLIRGKPLTFIQVRYTDSDTVYSQVQGVARVEGVLF